ncbi:MAG: hypothetical protein JNL57_13615 [Bacteroidetes bacterium]|nr:hypothetical protein [Bacteroidota bacterium]
MINILQNNNKIIINTDIDGVLSGLILQNYLGSEIVGFSNSDNTVWIDKSKTNTIYDAVYIDMYVPRSTVGCVDQHIVCVNAEHHARLIKNSLKSNPNLDNPRYHLPNQSYYVKYPFGTIHYIIAKLEGAGIKINLNGNSPVGNLTLFDLILRADDAMKTSVDSPYVANAKDWWQWLKRNSNNGSMVTSLIGYLEGLNSNKVLSIKTQTTKLLTSEPFFCTSPDGGFKSILNNSTGDLNQNVLEYLNFIADSCGLNRIKVSKSYAPNVGNVNRTMLNNDQIHELIDNNSIQGQEIFSYAFVRSSNRDSNFSYTIM